ncbi:ABC transporter ATP-binding protein [Rhizobium jaguaris]|uniref:ABC transporter ATP-binding protein n=1 Tax=Rhizobium jaguaris TaxID=1312183 RepID=A0A387G3K9_9HYPH|nr:ABC transporter ATP-binding protein [Rhizobium jaguaris]AYG63945.1 ABC transporter ATP-binding protein [Rhizobium jaguaris]
MHYGLNSVAPMPVSPACGEPVLGIKGLRLQIGDTAILHGVDLAVHEGEAVGIVGESGSGKSMTWRAALGLLPKGASTSGEVTFAGRNILATAEHDLEGIRGRRIAAIFQDAASALNPIQRVGSQILESLRIHRSLNGAAAKAEMLRLLDQVGIVDAANRSRAYPHELSGGQNQRMAIAMALAGNPEILIADEPTTALDPTIQAQILMLLKRIQLERAMSVILISHDLGAVAALCNRVCVMYAGRIVEDAPTAELLSKPEHPYTRALIASIPPLSGERKRLQAIGGEPPDPRHMPKGCAYAPRCSSLSEECKESIPAPVCLRGSHSIRCFTATRALGLAP